MNRSYQMRLDGNIAKAIEDYRGTKLLKLQAYEDPKVDGTFAFRAIFDEKVGGKPLTLDFLTIGVPLSKVTHNDLEECDFSQWPPKSGQFTEWMVS